MRNLIIIVVALVFTFIQAYSQEVVISEIYLSNQVSNEWTELLIIEDNISLVGYTLRDNGSSGAWMGGIRFRDVRLWRNLRSGTVIVINHRGDVAVDDNKSDGYIEIDAENSTYFETFLANGNPGPLDVDYSNTSLNFNTTHDLIQIRNPKGAHVHCLGFITTGDYSVFNSLPANKILYTGSVSQNSSIQVAPGKNLLSYNAELSQDEITNGGIETKGLPNQRNSNDYENQVYWRDLRQPDWTNPGVVSTSIINNYEWIRLKWNAPTTISDDCEGYIVCRYIDNKNSPLELKDGRIYEVGQTIGIYKVIAIIPTLVEDEFIDKFEDGVDFECGRSYGYQVNAFRYTKSDINPEAIDFADERNARGRQYNESVFVSAPAVSKKIPPAPLISSNNDLQRFCSNEEIVLSSNINDKSKYQYEWYSESNGKLNQNDTILTVAKSGEYFLKIIDKFSGCENNSNTINIEIVEAPKSEVVIKSNNKTILNDTIIQVCEGKTLDLIGISRSNSNETLGVWLRNNDLYSYKNEVSISMSGIYHFVTEVEGFCADTSITIQIEFSTPDFDFSEYKLIFDADNSPSQEVIITNNSDEDLIINLSDISLTPAANYKIISPTLYPITIKPNETQKFVIKFDIAGFGEKSGKFTLSSICNYSKTVDLYGSRENIGTTILDADLKEIDFGFLPAICDLIDYATTVIIESFGDNNAVLYKPRFSNNNFELISNLFNTAEARTAIEASSQITFDIRVKNNAPGIYYDTLTAPYTMQGKTDTAGYINIILQAELYDPSIEIITKELDFSSFVSCKTKIDTFIVVRNTTITDVIIDKNTSNIDKASIISQLPFVIKSNTYDTINIHIDFTSSEPNNFHLLYNNPCELTSSDINIIPPTNELNITLENSNFDFGTVNNCEENNDLVKKANIIVSNDGAKIGQIIYSGTDISSNIYEDWELSAGDNYFDIILPSNALGIINDSIVFTIEPCNEIYTLYIVGERINPEMITLSKNLLDFGSEDIFVATNQNLSVFNPNADFSIVIESIKVPLPYELISHSIIDFPLIINPLEKVDLEIEFRRLDSGEFYEISEIFILSPCEQVVTIDLKGTSIDDRKARFKALLPEQESLELGKEKHLAVNLEFDARYKLNDLEISQMKFYFTYDYITLNILSINLSNIAQSTTSNLQVDQHEINKLVLTVDVTNPEKLIEGEFMRLEVLPLLGDKLKSILSLDSVEIQSQLPIMVETNETEITINGECELDNRLLEVAGNFGIVARSDNNGVNIDFSTISDENTVISIYDIQGNFVSYVVNSRLRPGNYHTQYNATHLANGVYFIVLKNGIRIKSSSFLIIK